MSWLDDIQDYLTGGGDPAAAVGDPSMVAPQAQVNSTPLSPQASQIAPAAPTGGILGQAAPPNPNQLSTLGQQSQPGGTAGGGLLAALNNPLARFGWNLADASSHNKSFGASVAGGLQQSDAQQQQDIENQYKQQLTAGAKQTASLESIKANQANSQYWVSKAALAGTPQAYNAIKQAAKASGADVSSLPDEWSPQLQQQLQNTLLTPDNRIAMQKNNIDLYGKYLENSAKGMHAAGFQPLSFQDFNTQQGIGGGFSAPAISGGNPQATPIIKFGDANKAASSDPAINGIIDNAAQANNVPNDLAHAVVKQESAGNPNAVSNKGAIGLTQLMPATAKDLGVTNIQDPTQNANGGMKYLSQQLQKYSSTPLALAAYNAGPGAVDKAVTASQKDGSDPISKLPAETQNYVSKITGQLASNNQSPVQSDAIPNDPDPNRYVPQFQEGKPASGAGAEQGTQLYLDKKTGGYVTRLAPGVGIFDPNVDPSLHGSAYAKTLDPEVAPQIKAVGNYQKESLASRGSSGALAQADQDAAVTQFNPNYKGQSGYKAYQEFVDPSSSTQKQLQSINTFAGHANLYDQALQLLDNPQMPGAADVRSRWKEAFGSALPTSVDSISQLMSNEIEKASLGEAGGEDDRKQIQSALSPKLGAAQLRQNLTNYTDLIKTRADSLNQTYQTGTGNTDFHNFLTPTAQKTFGVIPRISSPQDDSFQNLKSGHYFYTPDGKLKVKS